MRRHDPVATPGANKAKTRSNGRKTQLAHADRHPGLRHGDSAAVLWIASELRAVSGPDVRQVRLGSRGVFLCHGAADADLGLFPALLGQYRRPLRRRPSRQHRADPLWRRALLHGDFDNPARHHALDRPADRLRHERDQPADPACRCRARGRPRTPQPVARYRQRRWIIRAVSGGAVLAVFHLDLRLRHGADPDGHRHGADRAADRRPRAASYRLPARRLPRR